MSIQAGEDVILEAIRWFTTRCDSKDGAYETMANAIEIPDVEGSEIGPGGGEIVFENDRVRIWDIRLDAGERSKLHTHALDLIDPAHRMGSACQLIMNLVKQWIPVGASRR